MTSVSSVEKERKKEENVVLHVVTTNQKPTKSFVTSLILFGQKVSIRITPDRFETWNTFVRIAKEQKIKISHLADNAITEYVRLHSTPGTQLTLTPYMPNAEKSPVRVLCAFLNGATSDGRVHCTRHGGSWILGVACYSCQHNQLRKKKEP